MSTDEQNIDPIANTVTVETTKGHATFPVGLIRQGMVRLVAGHGQEVDHDDGCSRDMHR